MLRWEQIVPRRIKLPSRYQILITRPGRAPVSFSLSAAGLLALFLLLLIWAGSTLFFYRSAWEAAALRQEVQALSHQVRELSNAVVEKEQKNRELTIEAARMLERLDRFEAEIRALKERAGLKVEEEKKDAEGPLGAGRPADVEELFAFLDARIEAMQRELSGEVAPALERTLKREAATPRGYPLKTASRIASGFGVRRNPFGRGYEFHDGVDLPAWYGTPIYATAPGRVIEAGWSNVFGRYVKIDHGFGYQTLYGHMSRIAVKRGQYVGRGQAIGYVGSSGRSTGPHVHYSVFYNGKAVDPLPYLRLSPRASR